MKKFFYTMVAGVSMMLAACTSQPQATEMTPQKKDIGLQLYSIRQLIGDAEKFAANQGQVLADLAISDPAAFTQLVEKAKAAL